MPFTIMLQWLFMLQPLISRKFLQDPLSCAELFQLPYLQANISSHSKEEINIRISIIPICSRVVQCNDAHLLCNHKNQHLPSHHYKRCWSHHRDNLYITISPKKARMNTLKWICILVVGLFSAIVLVSLIFFKGADRVKIVGWFNMTFSVSVFAALLSIIRLVIRRKIIDFMLFFLSFFLTLSAIAWFFYGLLTHDIYVATPNILVFTFGIVQMVIYIVYKDFKKMNSNKDIEVKMPHDQVLAFPVVDH